MSMSKAMRQMPAQAGQVAVARGEAARVPTSDEACGPRCDKANTGSGLLGAALTRENMQRAFKRVRANKGAAGVDGLAIDQTAQHLLTHWPVLREQLLQGTYRPSPVRRVTIPKPDGGQRELGHPDGDGPIDPASIAASAATNFGPYIERTQLRLSTWTTCTRCGESRTGVCAVRQKGCGRR